MTSSPNNTSRMTALLAALRRERNGAVAAAMRPCGTACGLNYGVSLPTVRSLARAEQPDHAFARYLWQQDVRELRLAALHIAEPASVVPEEFDFWGRGIVNAELAEEAAFALLCRIGALPELFARWMAGEEPLLRYAALMAASRSREPLAAWIEPAAEAVRRAAVAAGIGGAAARSGCTPAQAARLTAQGAVALLAAVGSRNEENRQAVIRAAGSLGKPPAEDFVHEELAWRL